MRGASKLRQHALPLDHGADARAQLCAEKRFPDIIRSAGGEVRGEHQSAFAASDRNHRNGGQLRLAAQLVQEINAGTVGQLMIEQDQVGQRRTRRGEPLSSRRRSDDGRLQRSKHRHHQRVDVRVVVDDQDPRVRDELAFFHGRSIGFRHRHDACSSVRTASRHCASSCVTACMRSMPGSKVPLAVTLAFACCSTSRAALLMDG